MMRVLHTALVLCLACDSGGNDKAKPEAVEATPEAVEATPEAVEATPGPFVEYQRKSMASEANVKLRGLVDGVAMAYASERVGPNGELLVNKLPESVAMTPSAANCCKQPKGVCPPSPELWATPQWKAIMFDVSSPHRYAYALEVSGETFVATAVGDLDCDGKLSNYSISGRVQDGAVVYDPIKIVDPLE